MSFNNTETPRKPTGKPKYIVPMRPHNGTGAMEYYMEGEVKRMFCKLFPIHSNRRIMLWFGLSHSTVQKFAHKFGIKKNMTAVRKELARDVKKICEANGYYDSMRGKAPSEACIEAIRKMFEEGYHPLKALKEKSPQKYKNVLKKRSEERKTLFLKEKRRLLWGLEQKTNLRVKLFKMTRTAMGQKHAMIKKHNYFADPDHSSWVCWDSETDRSPRMEKTAQKHGLKIVGGY